MRYATNYATAKKKIATTQVISEKENAFNEFLKLCKPATEEISIDAKKEHAAHLFKKYENLD